MKRFVAITLMMFALPACAQPAHPEDEYFIVARDAYARGDRAALARAGTALKSHPLVPWVRYFQLSLGLKAGADEGVAAFLEHHEGSYLAEKLRAEWLKWLIDRQDWTQARLQFARLQHPDGEAICRGLEARLRLGEPGAAEQGIALVALPAPLAESCQRPLALLAARDELPADALWQRLLRQAAGGKSREARMLVDLLPAVAAPAWKTVKAVIEHPARHLARLPERFSASRRERGLAALAILRMAQADVTLAAARWQEIEAHFPQPESAYVRGRLALRAALTHRPEASVWFDQAIAAGAALDGEQHAWRVRAALRTGDWPAVINAIESLPENLAGRPEWLFWHGRALAALGRQEEARARYARCAGQPTFYGILAAEALGQTFTLPARTEPPTTAELAAVAATPGLERGLALIRADLRLDGIREWNWALTGMNDRQLLAAAEYARRHEVIDRAINTAERTRDEHDFLQRYPMPFFAQVKPRLAEVDLDPAWVYGLMRQESRFIMDAKSGAGARGLMQLMPATAKWVAKKIGMTHYQPGKVIDMDTNVTLGTNYLRMVMDRLDEHPVLATAAYNAGPGRARQWRAERPLEGAIYVETIPFDETRDYVKKVMANTLHYTAVMGQPTKTLTARLGTIRPRDFGDTTAESLP